MNNIENSSRPANIYFVVAISLIVIVGILATLSFLYTILNIIIIFTLAFILGYAINPFITFFENKGVPRSISIVGVLIIVIGMITLAFYFLIPAIIAQISALASQLPANLEKFQSWSDQFIQANPYLRESIDFNIILEQLERRLTTAIQSIIAAATGVVAFLFAFVLVFVIAFFGLANPGQIRNSAMQLVPPVYFDKTISIFSQINIKLGHYLRAVLFSGMIIGVVSVIGYSLLGVNYALTLGIVAGILELVPLIGPIIAGIAAVIVALFQDPVLAIYVGIFAFALQQFENQLIIPKLMSHHVDLHPVTVIFATLVMGQLLGLVGIFLAVPLASIIKIVIKEIYLPNIGEKS